MQAIIRYATPTSPQLNGLSIIQDLSKLEFTNGYLLMSVRYSPVFGKWQTSAPIPSPTQRNNTHQQSQRNDGLNNSLRVTKISSSSEVLRDS